MRRPLHRTARDPRTTRWALVGAVTVLLAVAGCTTGTPADDPSTDTSTGASTSGDTTAGPDASPADPTDDVTEGSPATNGPNSILVPGDGAEVDGPDVTVSGDGTAFEATLNYTVTDADGALVTEGFTMAGSNGEVGPYEFTLTLDPGTYTVTVFEAPMGEDGDSGDPLNPVQVTFTVR